MILKTHSFQELISENPPLDLFLLITMPDLLCLKQDTKTCLILEGKLKYVCSGKFEQTGIKNI
jgi:hypothetical protein